MKKILVVSSTPRSNGNSDILASRIAEAAAAAGAQVELVRLRDLDIAPCTGCDACQGSAEDVCVQDDDMAALRPKLLEADALVLASPIYFFTVCAQMKTFMDRTYALGGGDWTALAGKDLALVFTYGDSNPLHAGVANAYGTFQDACRFLGMKMFDTLPVSCGAEGEVLENAEALAAAEDMGRRLAQA